jgi:hypothetical protein
VRSHPFVRAQVADGVLEPVVADAIKGEVSAWRRFLELIYPGLDVISRRFRLTSRLSDREDERDNVTLAVMERLHERGFARLRLLHQVLVLGNDGGWPWIATVASRTAIDCTRSHPENIHPRAARGEVRWVGLVPLPDGVEDRLPESARVVYTAEAREMMKLAEAFLSRPQLRALRLWLVGCEHAEIARKVRLESAHDADLLVRSALNALRRRYRKDDL